MPLPASAGSADRSADILGSALEQLMSEQCLPPREVRRVCRATELPLPLQHLLCTLGPEQSWRAFTDGAQWWFGIALARAPRPEDPTLEFDAYFFCKDALLWASGRWTYTSRGGVDLHEVYDTTDSGQDVPWRAPKRNRPESVKRKSLI